MGEVFDIRTGRKRLDPRRQALQDAKDLFEPRPRLAEQDTEELIRTAASTIVAVATIESIITETGRATTAPTLMYKDINDKLDRLDVVDQENAWRQATEVLDVS